MEIRNLIKLEILDKMCGMCLNNHINLELFDWYILKDINWLFENRSAIIDEYSKNYLNGVFNFEFNNYTKEQLGILGKYTLNEMVDIINE